jgi:hypothetical protein
MTEDQNTTTMHFASDHAMPIPHYDDEDSRHDNTHAFVGMFVGGGDSRSSFSSTTKRGSCCRNSGGRLSTTSSITMTDFDYAEYLMEEFGHLNEVDEEEEEGSEKETLPQEEGGGAERSDRYHRRLRRSNTVVSIDSVPTLPLRRESSNSHIGSVISSSSSFDNDAELSKTSTVNLSRQSRSKRIQYRDCQPSRPGRRISAMSGTAEQISSSDCKPSMPGRRVSAVPALCINKNEKHNSEDFLPQRMAKLSAFATQEGRGDEIPLRPARHHSSKRKELLLPQGSFEGAPGA